MKRLNVSRARHLRRHQTEAETALWLRLRNRGLGGFKFRRQVPVGPYVADFLCAECKLIIEADGGQHADSAKDMARTRFLESEGYRVLRFWNNDILSNMDGVLEAIRLALDAAPHPPIV